MHFTSTAIPRLLCLLCVFWPLSLSLEAQIPFQRSIPDNDRMDVRSMVETPNGGVVMCGVQWNGVDNEGFMLRLDPCGDLEFMRTYNFGDGVWLFHAIVTLDGGYLLTGNVINTTTAEDLIVIKTDGSGNILWHQTFQGGSAEFGFSVEEVRSNGLPQAYLISGATASYGEGNLDILMLSLDLNGGINWQRQYGGVESEFGVQIVHDGAGGVVCVGNTNSFSSGADSRGFVLHVDLNTGNPNWFKTYQIGSQDFLHGIELANNGDLMVVGQTDARGIQAQNDYWFMRLDPQGNQVWSKVYGTDAEERAFEVINVASGGFAIGAFGVDLGGGDTDITAIRTDNNGNILWANAYGTPDADVDFQFSHYNIGNNLAGGFWLGSSTYTANFNVNPIFIFTDSTGNSGGLCQEYPQNLITQNINASIAQPSLAITAFGFSTPTLPTVQSYIPNIVELCPQEQLYLGPDTILCPNQSMMLGVAPSPGASYLWSTNEVGTSINVSQAGTYWLEVLLNGCPRRDTIVIDFHPDLDLITQTSLSICQGDSIELSVPQGVNTWQWTNGSLDSSIWISQAGGYGLSAATDFCTYLDSFQLFINQPPQFDLGPDTSICPNSIFLLDVFTPGASYVWQDASMQSDFEVVDSGLYYVAVSIGPCVLVDSIDIALRTLSVPSLGMDTTLCIGEHMVLQNPLGNQSSLWSDGSAGDSLVINQAGIYWLESFDGYCAARDSFELFILQDEAVDLGADTSICAGETLILDPGFPGTQHLWQGGIDQLTYQVDSTGWYWVQVVAPLCDDTDSIFVTVVPPPIVEIGLDSIRFCLGDSAYVDINEASGLIYQWDDGLMGSDRWLSDEGWYRLYGSDSLCQSVDSIYVSTPMVPTFTLGADTSLCEGDSIVLAPDTYLGELRWSDNSQNLDLVVTRSGEYWLEQDVGSCQYRDSISLDFLPYPIVALGADTTLCEGQSLLLGAAPQVDLQYLWQDGSTNASLEAIREGLYSLQVTRGQCASFDELLLSYDSLPAFSLGPDTAFCSFEDGLLLSPKLPAYQSLQWSDGLLEAPRLIEEAGIYTLSLLTPVCGEIVDTVEVNEYPCICPLFFPTAFSPNQDGVNESFAGIGECQPLDYELLVFNRWGNLMFSSNEKDANWDGRYNGRACAEGVYVWVARYRFRDRGGWRDDFQRGTVSLIR